MINLIPKKENIFSKIFSWFKNNFIKNKINNEDDKIVITNDENIEKNKDENVISIRKDGFKNDLDIDAEKERLSEIFKDVVNNKIDVKDLDFSDMIKVSKLL